MHQVLLLPHPSCIRSWAASVDCEPGFLCDVISFLGNAAQNNAVLSDVVLIVDPMAIRKGTWWDAKQRAYVGRVDYGTGMPEADDDLSTEALVFMISGVSGHWKHPIGYFLQNKMSASVQAQLIKDCIGLLSAEKLNVVALVFRWFKFTLKPPYSIAHDKLRLAIWDTSFWTFWLKFGHKGP